MINIDNLKEKMLDEQMKLTYSKLIIYALHDHDYD